MAGVAWLDGLEQGMAVRLALLAAEQPALLTGAVAQCTRFSLTVSLTPRTIVPAELTAGAEVALYRPDGRVTLGRVTRLPVMDERQLTLAPLFARGQGAERRHFLRLNAVNLTAHAFAISFTLQLVDLSAGGMRFVSRRPFDPHERLLLRLPLFEQIGLGKVRAQVVWQRRQDQFTLAGAEFVGLSERQRAALGSFLFAATEPEVA